MSMDSSKFMLPLKRAYTVVFILFSLVAVSSSSIFDEIRYDDHCATVVPKATDTDTESTILPFPTNQQGYFLGGVDVHPDSSNYSYSSSRIELYLRTDYVYKTSVDDVHKVVADLILETQGTRYIYVGGTSHAEPMFGPAEFKLEGFWSLSTGNLCMVGSTPASNTKKAKGYAILKLSGVKSSCDITSLITGMLERSSTLSSPFQPFPLLMFPMKKCEAAKVLQAAASGLPAEIDTPKELSLSLPHSNPFCSLFDVSWFQLDSSCKSPNGCNPFGKSLGYQPQKMSLNILQCSEDTRSASFLVKFPNSSYVGYDQPFNTSSTLVAHGTWDAKKRQLFAVACRLFAPASSTSDYRVDDCSIRLSLRSPATWSVENTSVFVGYLWSNKKKEESGYFDRIKYRSFGTSALIQGLKYNYTLVERATSTCPKKNPRAKVGKQYPEGKEYEMQFSMSIKNIKGNGSLYGYSTPVFVDDQPWNPNSVGYRMIGEESSQVEENVPHNPVNISYDMSFTSYYESSGLGTVPFRISAEGTYNPGTGLLCMIGCKYPEVWTSATDATDCEILVVVQFPPINTNKHIEGRIESTRGESDHLHFGAVSFSAVPYYSNSYTTWRMDFEIIMALVSNTLVCIFVAYQIMYVKKRHNVFRLISLVMLVVLTLGQMIPLLLNFEALFSSRRNNGGYYGSGIGGWVEINEVFVRVITMVAFLLQVRLLQLVFSARMTDGNQKTSWTAEKKTLCVCLPLYIAGGLIAFLVNRKNYGFGEAVHSRRRFYRNHRSIWNDSTSFAGLILDGFLLPQVLFNIFQSSSEHPLSCIFYLGTTFVRLVPHAYDLYRAHNYIDSGSYMYADPGADYFSTAWDATILVFGILLAALIFLQQRFGGRCILPKRFKLAVEYERLPVETSDA